MIKKVLPWILMIALFVFIIIGLVFKDDMNNYLSVQMQELTTPDIAKESSTMIDSLYNYETNGLSYEITFLEFGAMNCSACKRMEKVMEDIRIKYPKRVNVVFLNVMDPENQKLMKFYGISTIPTQVLLNVEGKQYYRHMGYISTIELEKVIQ
jgi:thiol-disulfide isomerase/thioredoxin